MASKPMNIWCHRQSGSGDRCNRWFSRRHSGGKYSENSVPVGDGEETFARRRYLLLDTIHAVKDEHYKILYFIYVSFCTVLYFLGITGHILQQIFLISTQILYVREVSGKVICKRKKRLWKRWATEWMTWVNWWGPASPVGRWVLSV